MNALIKLRSCSALWTVIEGIEEDHNRPGEVIVAGRIGPLYADWASSRSRFYPR